MKWLVLLAVVLGCTTKEPAVVMRNTENPEMAHPALTLANTVGDMANHSAFRGFGDLLLPWNNNARYYATPLSKVGSLMPYHGHVQPAVVLAAVNHLVKEVNSGKTIFYSFYSPQQKKQDASKNQTGIFFFRGKPGAPFAVVCPGGGFSYVGSLHEGFPLAQQISENHLNAFVIRYRIGSEQQATEDLAAAIAYIVRNAEKLGVSTLNYSLWGGSAGARMVGNIALSGVAAFGGGNTPRPATAVIAYTGQSTYSTDFPPTFITVAANDGIANVKTVERRVANLKAAGVDVVYRRYLTAGHGFGTGKGTDAAGWMHDALGLWEKHIRD